MLNDLKENVRDFEKKTGFDKTDVTALLAMIDEELATLKKNKKDKKIVDHELIDLHVLLLQLANRYETDLDVEWKKHWKKSEKYMN